MGLGWYEAYSDSDEPSFVNLDMCYRLTVGPATGRGSFEQGRWAVLAHASNDRAVPLAGTFGTREESIGYLRALFEDAAAESDEED